MRIWIALLIGLAAGAAGATTFDDADKLERLKKQYQELKELQRLQASDIAGVSCHAQLSADAPRTDERVSPRVRAAPTDAGWAGLLTSLNAVVNSQIAAKKAELEALGVTGVP